MINLCIIGTGRAGMIHARNFANRFRDARVTALCDSAESNLVAAANELQVKKTYSDYREALADPDIDAVIVVTPTVLHREIVCAAAEEKKHVLCEKPMAMNEEE